MKIKRLRNKDGRELLRVSLAKKDTFDYATASQLAANTQKHFLPLAFSGNGDKPDLYYDLTGCISLETQLGSRVSRQQFDSVVGQLIAALDDIGTGSLSEKNLLLAIEYVFIRTEDSRLKLVYLPFTGREADDRPALDLLEALAAGSRFLTEEDSEYARSFLDFLRKQSVFSVVAMQDFLGQKDRPQASKKTEAASAGTGQTGAGGRDFVSERSGALSRTQITGQRSVSENIIAAVSESFNAPDELRGASSALQPGPKPATASGPEPQGASAPELKRASDQVPGSGPMPVPETTPEPESAPGPESTPEPESTPGQAPAPLPAPDTTPGQAPAAKGRTAAAHTGETGTTFLASWNTPLVDEPAAERALQRCWLIREADGTKWELSQGSTIIGRSKTCDIQVSDSMAVSRQHAVLALDDQSLTICDKGSSNGTKVNGRRIDPGPSVPLQNGGTFVLGDVLFSIRREA